MNKLLQVYGKNTGAQDIVQTELTSAFPSLVEQFDMVNRIYEKFYDWLFPFVYTEDGGADMTWRASVRSWIAKNPKLAELEAHFAQGTLSGTFTENIDDTDDTTFTDNRATKQKTTFKGVDMTSSGALADEVANEFEQGKNTTENARAYSRTRTYADGRNWVQVMKDVQAAEEPVYTFINSFARLLVSPAWCKQDFCEVLPPSVEMSTKTVSVPAGSEPTAEIVNRGTPFNADWLLSLGIPQGPEGPQGPQGPAALTYNNMYFSNVVPSASLQIIQDIGKFNRVPVVGDMCNFIVYYTGESPNTRPVYIVIGRCTVVDSSFATFETVNFAVIGGENGTDGQDGNDPNAVHFTEQTLNAEQQAQARTNIGAASTVDLAPQTTNVYAEITAANMFAYVYAHIVMQRRGNKADIHMDFRIDLRGGNPAANWTLFTTARLAEVLGLSSLSFEPKNTRVMIENCPSSTFGTVGGHYAGYTGFMLGFDDSNPGIGIGRFYNQPSNDSVGPWEVTKEEVYNEDYIYHADIWGADVS